MEVIAVPAVPLTVMFVGLIDGPTYVKRAFARLACASVLVTTTLAEPPDPTGDSHVIDVNPTTTTLRQAAPPTVTAAPLRKPVPVNVSVAPPRVDPDVGLTAETVGAGWTTVTDPGEYSTT